MKHTQQTAFDAALNGVRNQGYRQSRLSGSCLYYCIDRSNDDQPLRCGVGHMMTESTAIVANGSIASIMHGYYDAEEFGPVVKDELQHLGIGFLGECQSAHDSMRNAENFEYRMGLIAQTYGLNYTAPVQS